MTRIKKDGEYFYFFCEECDCETIHLVIVKNYEIDHVKFATFCSQCFLKQQDEKFLLKQGLISKVEDFYGHIYEFDLAKWESFVKNSRTK